MCKRSDRTGPRAWTSDKSLALARFRAPPPFTSNVFVVLPMLSFDRVNGKLNNALMPLMCTFAVAGGLSWDRRARLRNYVRCRLGRVHFIPNVYALIDTHDTSSCHYAWIAAILNERQWRAVSEHYVIILSDQYRHAIQSQTLSPML